jgi:small-conductance mechanosensitive channel
MNDVMKFPLLSRIVKRAWLQVIVLSVLISGHVVLEFIPDAKEHPIYPKILSFVSVWVVAWIVSRIVTVFREAPFVEAKLAANLQPLVFLFIRILIYSLAMLFALDSLGVSITPLLASLGVGSLAVGLALQDTLGNLFSGFYLYLDRPIAIGDWIRLENGIEGQVVSIGWRSTHLHVLQDNRVVIPNSKLSSSVLVNFNLPIESTTLMLFLGVAYEMDLEKVEKTLLECVARVASRMKGFLESDGAPMVRFTKFSDSSIDLSLAVKVRSFPDQGLIRHELIKEITATFTQENIEIPYPKRVVKQMPLGL